MGLFSARNKVAFGHPRSGREAQRCPRIPAEPLGRQRASLTELGMNGGRPAHEVRPPPLHRIPRRAQPLVFIPNQLENNHTGERSTLRSTSLWG